MLGCHMYASLVDCMLFSSTYFTLVAKIRSKNEVVVETDGSSNLVDKKLDIHSIESKITV